MNDKEADAFYAWYLDHTQHGGELKDTAIEAWNQSRDHLLSLLDTQETKEAVARVLQREHGTWIEAMLDSTAALSTIKRILTGKE